MSREYISAIIIILVSLCNAFKVNIGTEEITPIIEGIFGVGSAIYIIWRKVKKGEITVMGQYKRFEK